MKNVVACCLNNTTVFGFINQYYHLLKLPGKPKTLHIQPIKCPNTKIMTKLGSVFINVMNLTQNFATTLVLSGFVVYSENKLMFA